MSDLENATLGTLVLLAVGVCLLALSLHSGISTTDSGPRIIRVLIIALALLTAGLLALFVDAVSKTSKRSRWGHEVGAVRYFVGSLFRNTLPMYVFGGGVLALLEALSHGITEGFFFGTFHYLFTKYLPPTSPEQIVFQLFVGTGYAAVKWYVFTPRRRGW